MYARIHFSTGQQPYDRRGEVYIRYGEPDDRRRFVFRRFENPDIPHMLTGIPAVDAIRERNLLTRLQVAVTRRRDAITHVWSLPNRDGRCLDKRTDRRWRLNPDTLYESWVYVPHDLELFFVDTLKDG